MEPLNAVVFGCYSRKAAKLPPIRWREATLTMAVQVKARPLARMRTLPDWDGLQRDRALYL